jgi:AraC-like DNA-binding protein
LLNESRIRLVCQRLVNGEYYGHLTIAAIANTVGYNSMNNFILFFKRIVGMTPSKYRQLALKEQQKGQME